MKECPSCGLLGDDFEKYCLHCGAIYSEYIESNFSQLKKYGISPKVCELIIDCSFVGQVKDNCIVYNNGIVDSFDSPEGMMLAIKKGDGLSELAEDIHMVLLDNNPCKISLHNKVVIIKPDNYEVQINGYVSQEDMNSAKILVIMGDVAGSIVKFNKIEDLAAWINNNGGDEISMIFIDKIYHDWEIRQFIKIADTSIELEQAPF